MTSTKLANIKQLSKEPIRAVLDHLLLQMASNVTLSYFGPPEQKHIVKVPPMQTLSQAVQAAAAKFKPALVPEHCVLQYNKKSVDLHTPFRLLNIPAGSKLEVIILGPSTEQAASAPQPTAVASSSAPQTCQQPTDNLAAAANPPEIDTSEALQQPEAATAAATTKVPHAVAPTNAGAGAGPSSSTADQHDAASASNTVDVAAAPSPLACLGVVGPVHVFSQKTLEAAAGQSAGRMDLDPPDDFFELTTDDLVRLQQHATEKKRSEAMLKPRSLRQAEEAARVACLGPVRVRLHFPDATICQATFEASQPLSAVQQLVTQLAQSDFAPALYLYTTPPKKVLKDPSATLYQLQLVPAAHLYVGCNLDKLKPAAATAAASAVAADGGYRGCCLRPEVLAIMQDKLPDAATSMQQQQDHTGADQPDAAVTAADAQRVLAASAAATRADAEGRHAAGGGGGGKVPKWLKMGK